MADLQEIQLVIQRGYNRYVEQRGEDDFIFKIFCDMQDDLRKEWYGR